MKAIQEENVSSRLKSSRKSVYSLNLDKISQIIGCSETDLIDGIHTKNAMAMTEMTDISEEDINMNKTNDHDVKDAVIIASTYSIYFEQLLCLMSINEEVFLVHLLKSYLEVGIERIILIVSNYGERIAKLVKECNIDKKIIVEIIYLKENDQGNHANAILEVKKYCTGRFLLQYGHCIYEKGIIQDLIFSLYCKEDIAQLSVDLKSTDTLSLALQVTIKEKKINSIGKNLKQLDGIEIGLYLISPNIFNVIEDSYTPISWEQLFSKLAAQQQLGFTIVDQMKWLNIDKEIKVDKIQEKAINMTRIQCMTEDILFSNSTSQSKAYLASINASYRGFVIETSQGDSNKTIRKASICAFNRAHDKVSSENEGIPLLERKLSSPRATSFRKSQSVCLPTGSKKRLSFSNSISLDPFVLSLPVDESKINSISKEAYLIGIDPDKDTVEDLSEKAQFVLAIPETPGELEGRRQSRFRYLPSDVAEVIIETAVKNNELEVQIIVNKKVPPIGFVLLFTALFSISSLGAVLDLQIGAPPILKFFWRVTATCVAFLPAALYSIAKDPLPPLSFSLIRKVFLCALAWSYFNGAFVWALDHTSVGHAYLFGNTQALILVLGKFLYGIPVVLLEGIGAGIGLLGGTICTVDHGTANGLSTIVQPSLSGDFMALTGSIGGVFYLIYAKELRPQFPISVFMFGMAVFSSFILLFSSILIGETVTFSMDSNTGMFGWLNLTKTRFLVEVYLVLVGSVLGTTGYVLALKYFDPLVVAVVMLTEPLIACIFGILLKVDSLPGIATFIGGVILIVGTGIVVVSASETTESIDATEAIQVPDETKEFSRRHSLHHYGSFN